MEPGYVMDHTGQSAGLAPQWVEGAPEKSFWTGVRTTGRAVLPVTTYRCERCGYLESYANPAPEAP
jgi:hypothetical protein